MGRRSVRHEKDRNLEGQGGGSQKKTGEVERNKERERKTDLLMSRKDCRKVFDKTKVNITKNCILHDHKIKESI